MQTWLRDSLLASHRTLVTVAVDAISRAFWPGYTRTLTPTQRRQWRNKITCGLHAAVLAYGQAWNLADPVLYSDPLHGVTGASRGDEEHLG